MPLCCLPLGLPLPVIFILHLGDYVFANYYAFRQGADLGFTQTVLLPLAARLRSSCEHPGPGCLMSLWSFVPVFHFWHTWP